MLKNRERRARVVNDNTKIGIDEQVFDKPPYRACSKPLDPSKHLPPADTLPEYDGIIAN